jgi:hypothetical protein
MSSSFWPEGGSASASEDSYGSLVAPIDLVHPAKLWSDFHEEGQYAEAPPDVSLEIQDCGSEPPEHSLCWTMSYVHSGPPLLEHEVMPDELQWCSPFPHYFTPTRVGPTFTYVSTIPFTFRSCYPLPTLKASGPSPTWSSPPSTGCKSLVESSHRHPLTCACDYDITHPPLLSCPATRSAYATIDEPPG